MEIKINGINGICYIGDGHEPYVIAEAGINHNGSMEIAKKLIYEAKIKGANAIKFQKRTIEEMFTKAHLDRPYEKSYSKGITYGQHKHEIEFTDEQYMDLYAYAKGMKIDFLCSGFDSTSFDFIENKLNVPIHKIASPFVTDYPLLKQVASYGKPMILSTGMYTMKEIEHSVKWIKQFNEQLIVLQATTLYPCPDEYADLNAIPEMKKTLGTLVGYSSHDKGVILPAASIALGGCLIEKHFTLDRTMVGPDHVASCEPRGLELICNYARTVFKGLGSSIKRIHPSEDKARLGYGVSIVSKGAIKKGDVISEENIMVKYPGGGISPEYFYELLGKRATKDITPDTIIYDGEIE